MRVKEQRRLQEILLVSVIAFGCLATILVFWSLFRADALWQREDNPRAVLEELEIRRGHIVDRHGILLAETVGVGEQTRRSYPYSVIGPAVGYYSFKYGTAGAEAIYDLHLRGEPRDWVAQLEHQWLHMPYVGKELQLTLDITAQQLADQLLGEQNGAVLLLAVPDGEIRAMVSHPTYDPNRLDEQLEVLQKSADSPLFNRVFQGRYQPGMILTPFYFMEAIERSWIDWEQSAVSLLKQPLKIEGVDPEIELSCVLPEGEPTVAIAFQASCPRLVAGLEQWQTADLFAVWDKYQFQEPLFFEQQEITGTISVIAVDDIEQELVGQGGLTISPAQLLLAWGRLVQTEGVGLQLVSGDRWAEREAIDLDEKDREQLLSLISERDGRFVEYLSFAQSGPNKVNSWYLGGIPAENPEYIIVILVENWSDLEQIRKWGREILNNSFNE